MTEHRGKTFKGDFRVGCLTDGTLPFEMRADEFILREESVGFTFSGQDDPARGCFLVTGTATSSGDDIFRCVASELKYKNEGYVLLTDFEFEAFEILREGAAQCYVSGELTDESGRWIFHGLLPAATASR